jgi:hypothetical protein
MACSWRRIKRDFLSHFGNPRLDLLVWVLVRKLQPLYIRIMQKIRYPTGRPRDARSWRKEFKREWKVLYARETSPQDEILYTRYNPDPHRWVCACPAFRRSRFLICKHLVKLCHPVDSRFFLNAQRNRTTPFWSHPTLIPIQPSTTNAIFHSPTTAPINEQDEDTDAEGSDDDLEETLHEDTVQEIPDRLEAIARILERFTPLLRAQKQYSDLRFYMEQGRQLDRAIGFMEDCLEVERLENSRVLNAPTTWGRKSTTMYLYPRPPHEIGSSNGQPPS